MESSADKAEDVTGALYDLTLKVEGGKVTDGHRVEAITWGDLHATCLDPIVLSLAAGMLDVLNPKHQFMHDLMEGASVNHHGARNPLERFKTSLRGLTVVRDELIRTVEVLKKKSGPKTEIIISSNDIIGSLKVA